MALGPASFVALAIAAGAVPAEVPDMVAEADDVAISPANPDEDPETFSLIQQQVQVERRVIVRITPFSARRTASELEIPAPPPPAQERAARAKGGRCVPLADVEGVRLTRSNGLLLFMRDRRVYSAQFDRQCPVQGFYSGFYVERAKDGMLCAGRDEVHARSGVDCTLAGISPVRVEQGK